MKKKLSSLLSLFVVLTMVLIMLPERANAASASLSGSSTVKAGGTVTLTLSVSGSDIYGMTATLNYSSALSFTNYSCNVSGWSMDVSGSNFILYGTSPIGSSSVVTVTFNVSSSATQESDISASFSNIVISNGDGDENLSTASWSGKIEAAKSKDCTLKALSCSNGTLAPGFSADNTYYSMTVPYSVSALNLSVSTNDANASYSISGNNLVVGTNTVTIKVTAPSGDTRTYTITVTRQQDPNYKKSNDATLSEMTLEGGTISPAFDAKITDYVCYVPYEVESVKLSGKANSSKAIKVTECSAELSEEVEAPLTITCTAEDGTTTTTYTVHVIRMPKYEGILPTIAIIDPNAPVEEPVVEEPVIEEPVIEEPVIEEPEEEVWKLPLKVNLPYLGATSTKLVTIVCGILLAIILLLIGELIGRISARHDYEDDDEEEEEEEIKAVPPTRKTPRIEEKKTAPVEDTKPVRKEKAKAETPSLPAAKPPVETPAPKAEEKTPEPAAKRRSLHPDVKKQDAPKVSEKPELFDFDNAKEEDILAEAKAMKAEKAAQEKAALEQAAKEAAVLEQEVETTREKAEETFDLLTEEDRLADELVGNMSIDDILNDIHNM